jgi:hypothetical protein
VRAGGAKEGDMGNIKNPIGLGADAFEHLSATYKEYAVLVEVSEGHGLKREDYERIARLLSDAASDYARLAKDLRDVDTLGGS